MTARTAWPDGLTREPWEHQHIGYDVLGRLWYDGQPGVGLISEAGTGKSLIAIALIKAYGFRRVLIISGTKAMVEEWPDMIHAETPEIVAVPLLGNVDKRASLMKFLHETETRPVVFVTNVESYHANNLGYRVEQIPWDCIIFDESQRIKGAGSQASLFAYRLAKLHPRALRLIMTGTPFHDKPLDVYGQFRFLDARIFGTRFNDFKERYVIEERIGPGITRIKGYKNLDELREKVRAVTFHVDDSVLNLPPLMPPIIRRVRLTPATTKAYVKLAEEFVVEFERGEFVVAANALARMTRLQQLTSGFVGLDDGTTKHLSNEKAEALASLLVEFDESKPVVVFARFRHDLDRIKETALAAGRAYYEQSGDCSEWRDWRAADDNAVIGVQLQAGSSGINLTRSPYAVFYSFSFSLGDYEQAVKRVHRPGQTERTFIYHLVASVPGKRSVDSLISQALREKREINSYLLEEAGK